MAPAKMVKQLMVEACWNCPYNKGFWCSLKVREIEHCLNIQTDIPIWCPLEDS